SSASKLIKAVTGAPDTKVMPPKEPRLTAKEIALLKAWIDQGARAPAREVADAAAVGIRHWAFLAPEHHPAPLVKQKSWIRNPIDRFSLARLEKEGIAPSAEAD